MKLHRVRILAMQAIFQTEFQNRSLEDLMSCDWIDYSLPDDEKEFTGKIIKGVNKNLKKIDSIIKEYSEHWDFKRISPVNKAILRISFYQFMEMLDQIPPKVIIDEAICLANEYAEHDSSRFINGMLDAFYQNSITAVK